MAVAILNLQQKIQKKISEAKEDLKKLRSDYDLEARCHDYYDDADSSKPSAVHNIEKLIARVEKEIRTYEEFSADCAAMLHH